MRLLVGLTALLALLAVGALPPALADHPIDHMNVVVDDLEPGERHRLEVLSLDHDGLRPGWIYLIYGAVQGNHSLQVEFQDAEGTLETWRWAPNQFTTNTTKIQREGQHHVVVSNPGPEPLRYTFYYDQSCNCAGKPIPLPGGVVLFNNPFPAGHDLTVAFPLVEDWHVRGVLATHDEEGPTARWPQDFQLLQEQEAQGPGAGETGHGWLNFTFRTTETRMHYFHLTALGGTDAEDPIFLTPIWPELAADVPEESPLPLLPGLALLAGILVAAARFRRSA